MKLITNNTPCTALFTLTCLATLSGCVTQGKPETSATVMGMHAPTSTFVAGYLPATAMPDSLAILPPPPAAGSAALALDEEVARNSVALRGSPRWLLATADAEYRFPQSAEAFSCSLNVPITKQDTPRLYTLLQRTFADAAASTNAAKNHYKRARPFVVNKEPTCTPNEEKHLVNNGSYPSGHSAFGWAWALVLAEVSPEQADALLTRGRVFDDSRSVCNVHWHSDIVEGRYMGTATVARLHAQAEFRADVDAAKAEVAAARVKGLKPTRDCAEEAAQMNYQAPLQQPTVPSAKTTSF